MPFDRPTLPALINQVRADFLQRLTLDDPLRRADAEVHARVVAGALHGMYGYASWLALQLFPDTAEAEHLDRLASIWLNVPRKPASPASGTAAFTVQPTAVVPVGTALRTLDGVEYVTTGPATGAAPTLTAPIAAVVAAEAGNRDAGDSLSLVSPVPGVQPVAVASALSGGADIESDDALRARLLSRIRLPPQGGSANDYVTWALEVPGVTRAWCYPEELGAGTVVVRFMRDGDADPLPDAGAVDAVQDYINARRPVCAAVSVAAPVPVELDFTITDLVPDTTAVRAAVEAELADLLTREAAPGGGILLSHIRAAISAAAGEADYVLTLPAANVVNAAGELSVLGTVTWA